jgi:FkbM family methyltransferase
MKTFKSSFLGKEILMSDKCKTIWGATVYGGEIQDELLIYNFYNSIIFNRNTINFFDIGSNTGSFIFLPVLNSTINCFAFEPNPLAYDVLLENIEINNLQNNVHPYNMGLWHTAMELELKIPIDTTDSGLATFGDNPSRFTYADKTGEFTKHKVKCETIDNMFQKLKLESLDIIKIDTEGAELSIIKGGETTIKQFKPNILLEFDNTNTGQFGYKCDDIILLLQSYGYTNFNLLGQSDLLASTL